MYFFVQKISEMVFLWIILWTTGLVNLDLYIVEFVFVLNALGLQRACVLVLSTTIPVSESKSITTIIMI